MKFRFVVVDDAAFLREILKSILTSAGGFCVGEAGTGDEAIEVAQATLPDVVFLDMVMPGRNGIETAKAIRQFAPKVKIVGCSTIDEPALVEKAFAAGFDEYILKPFSQDQVVAALHKAYPYLGESNHGST